MQKIVAFVIGMVFAGWLAVGTAGAVDYGSKEEAKQMAERAAAYFQAEGKDKAFTTFSEGAEGFKDRDLYVFVYADDGTCVAHGANKAMIGRNLIDLKDADGKTLIRDIVAVKDTGWVEFKWRNPQTQAIQNKVSYVVRSGNYVFGVGAYQPN